MSQLLPTTVQRIVESMARLGTSLEVDENETTAHANLNGFHVVFATLGNVIIVRADSLSNVPTKANDAALYMAANQLNSFQRAASSKIIDDGVHSELIVRTEKEIYCAAGLSDAQLDTNLRAAVDGVLGVQDALLVAAEEFRNMTGVGADDN